MQAVQTASSSILLWLLPTPMPPAELKPNVSKDFFTICRMVFLDTAEHYIPSIELSLVAYLLVFLQYANGLGLLVLCPNIFSDNHPIIATAWVYSTGLGHIWPSAACPVFVDQVGFKQYYTKLQFLSVLKIFWHFLSSFLAYFCATWQQNFVCLIISNSNASKSQTDGEQCLMPTSYGA